MNNSAFSTNISKEGSFKSKLKYIDKNLVSSKKRMLEFLKKHKLTII